MNRRTAKKAARAGSLTVIVPVPEENVETLRAVLETVEEEIRRRDSKWQYAAVAELAKRITPKDTPSGPSVQLTGGDLFALSDVLAGRARRPQRKQQDGTAVTEILGGIAPRFAMVGLDVEKARGLLDRLRYQIPQPAAEVLTKARTRQLTLAELDALRSALQQDLPVDGSGVELAALGGLLGTRGAPTSADFAALQRIALGTSQEATAGHETAPAQLSAIEGLHFARWVILPQSVRRLGRETAPSLVLWTIFDGDENTHVTELGSKARDLLERVYEHCSGYKTGSSPEQLKRYLLSHRAEGRTAAFDGAPGRSIEIIRKQEALASRLKTCIKTARGRAPATSSRHLFSEVQLFVDEDLPGTDPDLASFARTRLTLEKPPGFPDAVREGVRTARAIGKPFTVAALLLIPATLWLAWKWRTALSAALGLGFGAGILMLPLLVPLALAALLALPVALLVYFLRRAERREALRWTPVPHEVLEDHERDLYERDRELPHGMNRMTIVTDLKGGYVRRVLMQAVLGVFAFLTARNQQGVLQGIETIHFAQWRLVDNGTRLLFMSNYDDDPRGYLKSFSANAAAGVNAIWGNSHGFPPTWLLVGEGAHSHESFMDAARAHQIPTDVWYTGYPDPRRARDLSQINRDWRIHELLNAHPTPGEVDDWLELVRS